MPDRQTIRQTLIELLEADTGEKYADLEDGANLRDFLDTKGGRAPKALYPLQHSAARRAKGRTVVKLSARNVLKGKIVEVKKGTVTTHVRLDIGGGVIVTSSITNEAVEELKLAQGDDAYAVVKASDVMVAKD